MFFIIGRQVGNTNVEHLNRCTSFTTLTPDQNGRYFADGIINDIFVEENVLSTLM